MATARTDHPAHQAATHEASTPEASAHEGAPLPTTRDALLVLHREARRRRDAAPLLSEERAAAMEEIGRIEVQIARIERAMDPPLV